jgi:hypothetical protein
MAKLITLIIFIVTTNAFSQDTSTYIGNYIYKSKDNISVEMNIFELNSDTSKLAFSIQYIYDKSDFTNGIELFPTGRFDENYDEEFNSFIIEKSELIYEEQLIFYVAERVDIDMGKDIWLNYIKDEKLKLNFHKNKTVSISFLNITKLLNEHFKKKYAPFDNVILTKKI